MEDPLHAAAPYTGLGEPAVVPEWQCEAQDDMAAFAMEHWGVVSDRKEQTA